MMNKIVYVEAKFKPIGKVKTVKVPTGEKKKGFFGGDKDVMTKEKRWEQTGWSDCEVNVRLLDHVVLANQQMVSLKEQALF